MNEGNGPMKKMKLYLSFLVLFLATVAGDCLGQSNPLVGTWELVSAKRTFRDGSSDEWVPAKNGGRAMKIYNETHYSLIGREIDGSFMATMAGSYVVNGNTSTEQIEFSLRPSWRDKKFVITFSIEGDTCRFTYVSPFDKAKVEDVLRRVK